MAKKSEATEKTQVSRSQIIAELNKNKKLLKKASSVKATDGRMSDEDIFAKLGVKKVAKAFHCVLTSVKETLDKNKCACYIFMYRVVSGPGKGTGFSKVFSLKNGKDFEKSAEQLFKEFQRFGFETEDWDSDDICNAIDKLNEEQPVVEVSFQRNGDYFNKYVNKMISETYEDYEEEESDDDEEDDDDSKSKKNKSKSKSKDEDEDEEDEEEDEDEDEEDEKPKSKSKSKSKSKDEDDEEEDEEDVKPKSKSKSKKKEEDEEEEEESPKSKSKSKKKDDEEEEEEDDDDDTVDADDPSTWVGFLVKYEKKSWEVVSFNKKKKLLEIYHEKTDTTEKVDPEEVKLA